MASKATCLEYKIQGNDHNAADKIDTKDLFKSFVPRSGGKEGFELEASISIGAVPNQPATS